MHIYKIIYNAFFFRKTLMLVCILMLLFFGYTQGQDNPATAVVDTTKSIIDESATSEEPVAVADSMQQKRDKLLPADKAALYSAVLPGLGQAYNKKYWKIPVIYGVGLLLAYQIKVNNDQYQEFRRAQLAIIDDDPRTENPYETVVSADPESKNPYNVVLDEDALDTRRNRFRRNRDFMIILTALWYFINIADAHVDVHLKDFDVSDDLSFRLKPDMGTTDINTPLAGVTLQLTLK